MEGNSTFWTLFLWWILDVKRLWDKLCPRRTFFSPLVIKEIKVVSSEVNNYKELTGVLSDRICRKHESDGFKLCVFSAQPHSSGNGPLSILLWLWLMTHFLPSKFHLGHLLTFAAHIYTSVFIFNWIYFGLSELFIWKAEFWLDLQVSTLFAKSSPVLQ